MNSTRGQVSRRWRVVAAAVAIALAGFMPAGAMPVNGQAQAPTVPSAGFEGRPVFSEGRDFGYYVWRDGAIWRVRWTTRGVKRRFSGHVVAEGGRLDHLKRIDLDEERRVVAPGRAPHVYRGPRGHAHVAPGHGPVVASKDEDKVDMDDHKRIDFVARTDDDIDGFDFEVRDGVDALRFTLEIDGRSRLLDVVVGARNAHPTGNPFVVRLR